MTPEIDEHVLRHLVAPRDVAAPLGAIVPDSPFVPVAGRQTPFPNWKQIDFVRETLPARDREIAMQMPAIDIMDYIRSIEES